MRSPPEKSRTKQVAKRHNRGTVLPFFFSLQLPIRHCPSSKCFPFNGNLQETGGGGGGGQKEEEEAHPLSKSGHVSLQAYINII